jgi:hypothetical protein
MTRAVAVAVAITVPSGDTSPQVSVEVSARPTTGGRRFEPYDASARPQYPDPLRVVAVVLGDAPPPPVFTTFHIPPKLLIPSPLVDPAPWSPLN